MTLRFTMTMLSDAGQQKETANITPSPDFAFSRQTFSAMGLRDYFLHGSFGGRFVPADLQRKAGLLKQMCAGSAAGDANARLDLEYSMSERHELLPVLFRHGGGMEDAGSGAMRRAGLAAGEGVVQTIQGDRYP